MKNSMKERIKSERHKSQLADLSWDSLLEYLGSSRQEVPMPRLVDIGRFVRQGFSSSAWAIYVNAEEDFWICRSTLHEGTHAINNKLTGGVYCDTTREKGNERIWQLLIDRNVLIDEFKKVSWEEGIAEISVERLLKPWLEKVNYSFVRGDVLYVVKKEWRDSYPKVENEIILTLGKDTGVGFDLPTYGKEQLTLDSLASIVGYFCVSKLGQEEIQRLVRDKNAHNSDALQFNTSYQPDVKAKIGETVTEYMKRGTYFDGIVLENLKSVVPGLESV